MKHSLTQTGLLRAAKALAEATNGGNWWTDYTSDQRQLWINRVREAMGQ
jgi:hypothetical protein